MGAFILLMQTTHVYIHVYIQMFTSVHFICLSSIVRIPLNLPLQSDDRLRQRGCLGIHLISSLPLAFPQFITKVTLFGRSRKRVNPLTTGSMGYGDSVLINQSQTVCDGLSLLVSWAIDAIGEGFSVLHFICALALRKDWEVLAYILVHTLQTEALSQKYCFQAERLLFLSWLTSPPPPPPQKKKREKKQSSKQKQLKRSSLFAHT